MKYDIGNGLSIEQNAWKVALLNGGKILAKAIDRGEFSTVIGDQEATLARVQQLVRNQIATVMNSLEGDTTGQEEILYRLKLHLVNTMLDQAV
jgi:hypothetical protein